MTGTFVCKQVTVCPGHISKMWDFRLSWRWLKVYSSQRCDAMWSGLDVPTMCGNLLHAFTLIAEVAVSSETLAYFNVIIWHHLKIVTKDIPWFSDAEKRVFYVTLFSPIDVYRRVGENTLFPFSVYFAWRIRGLPCCFTVVFTLLCLFWRRVCAFTRLFG
jgi:hypothetical protein